MKSANEPMSLDDIADLLLAASAASNHRRFVIGGSLSVIGAVIAPPREMAMSRDLDMYPELDPGRGFQEIAETLGQNSSFHRTHGFYADPITPQLLALPEGWDRRLGQISLKGGVIALFIEPNDAAIGKLLRGSENDMRWIEAGFKERILNPKTMRQRAAHVADIDFNDLQLLRSRLAPFLQLAENSDSGEGTAAPQRPIG